MKFLGHIDDDGYLGEQCVAPEQVPRSINVFDGFPMTHEQTLAQQQQRATQLARDRRCPHCQERLSLLEALSLVRGHGYSYFVAIKLPDDQVGLVRERDFNPQTMLWADDETSPPSRLSV